MCTKNEFMVEDWMVKDKGLSGNELVCYAFLWKQTQKGNVAYTGGYEKIAEAIGVTFPTAYNVLKKLREKGYVEYSSMSSITMSVTIKKY